MTMTAHQYVVASEQGTSQNVGTYTASSTTMIGRSPPIRSAAYRPRSIAFGDVNGDDVLEIALGDAYTANWQSRASSLEQATAPSKQRQAMA